MSLSNATVTMNLSDMLGTDFDTRRTKVWVSTNVPGDTVIDTVGNAIRLGTGTVTLNTDGTASVAVWKPGTGSNPASWQTYIHVDYPDAGTRTRVVRDFGPFTITTNADLADLIAEQDVPPEYAVGILAEMTALRDEAQAIIDSGGGGGGGGTTPDATTSVKGKVELATNAETVTGTDTVRATTPAGVKAAIAAGVAAVPSVLGAYLGQVSGAVVQPGSLAPTYGNELWQLANFRAGFNTTALAPVIHANGTTQQIRTLVFLGNLANKDMSFRLTGRIVSLPADGWAQVTVAPADSGGTIISGAVKQTIANNGPASLRGQNVDWPINFDFKAADWGNGDTYLDVTLDVFNNATTGDLELADMSLHTVATPQRPMAYGYFPSSGKTIYVPLLDPVAGKWRMVSTLIGADGALNRAIAHIFGYNTDRPFKNGQADPAFAEAAVSVSDAANTTELLLTSGEVLRSVRITNNDQILSVKKTDNTYELRCNTHGGETLRSGAANSKIEADLHGDGTWTTYADADVAEVLRTCRKVRVTYNTQIQRSDAGSPFANVDHLATFYGDGMMRMDRTTTFLADQRINTHFEWMSSHDTNTPKVGRIGNGLIVEDEVDVFPKVATPAVPANTPSTSGGLLAAGTRYYAVTALAEGGETSAGPTVSATNTGSTSSNVLTWAAVSGATGYRVYRGASPTTLVHIATVTPIASPTYTDAGAAALGTAPPPVNRARQLDAASTVFDSAVSDRASWAVWYDPILNMCMGNIYDREALAARPGVASVTTRLERGGGIMKNYINVWFTSDSLDLANDRANGASTASTLVTSGTVWTATHWAFTYVPADPANYHLEIAARATDLARLKLAYPSA